MTDHFGLANRIGPTNDDVLKYGGLKRIGALSSTERTR